jgi:hypothetical protein
MGGAYYRYRKFNRYILRPAALLNPLIQRLQHAGIHRGDDIDRRVQLFFAHSRFACIRKAPVDSRIAETHHRDRESDQHFLTLRETLDGVRFPIKSSKVCFFHNKSPSAPILTERIKLGWSVVQVHRRYEVYRSYRSKPG